MSTASSVQVRFFEPPAELRRYFTTFYLVEFTAPDGQRVVDRLHPEWANLRFFSGDTPDAAGKHEHRLSGTAYCVTGPSSHAVRFEVGTTRMWGIGLLPLGWARFVGVPACDYADAVVDGHTDPAFAGFSPLCAALFAGHPDPDAEYALIVDYFRARLHAPGLAPVRDEARITAIHAQLVDPEVGTVAELVTSTGITQRTVERICTQVFGFPPKLLLRRQRFMRSLAHYALDNSLKWIGALDGHYHDQAHFIREFRQFMGMTPRAYAALDKPILSAIMQARARFAGRAVQTLDSPQGGAAR